jgi:hypothetical protein
MGVLGLAILVAGCFYCAVQAGSQRNENLFANNDPARVSPRLKNIPLGLMILIVWHWHSLADY